MKKLTGWITLHFIVLLTLAQPAHSLGWKDKEWVDAGCPENITGKWIPRSAAALGEAAVTVTNQQFNFPLENGRTNTIGFEKISESSGSIVLALDSRNLPVSQQVLPYLRIRPHLVRANVEAEMNSLSQAECLIKVFRYQSLEKIQPNKYVNWNIYRIQSQKQPSGERGGPL